MMNQHDDELHRISQEHSDVVRIERLTHHIQRIREGMDEMKTSMREMASAVTRLALVEERQSTTSASIDRLADAVTKLDERLRVIEKAEPLQTKTSEWMLTAVWSGASAMAVFAAGKLGMF